MFFKTLKKPLLKAFFKNCGLVNIAMYTHLWNVQTCNFVFCFYPKRNNFVGNFKPSVHHQKNKNKAGCNTDKLRPKLASISVKQSFYVTRNAILPVSITTIGKKPNSYNAPGAIYAMYSKCSYRIVYFEFPIYQVVSKNYK